MDMRFFPLRPAACSSLLGVEWEEPATTLWDSIVALDARAADEALARVLIEHSMARALSEVFVPLLQRIGDEWEGGSLAAAHEHFASQLLRRRLSALAGPDERPVDPGPGQAPSTRVALLACPTGERHDLVLLCFALLLKERGWRAHFLGGDTSVSVLARAARVLQADVVVLAATRSTALTAQVTSVRHLAAQQPVFIAGRGADEEVAELLGARLMPDDPVMALDHLSGSW